jgi:hypothetical protein
MDEDLLAQFRRKAPAGKPAESRPPVEGDQDRVYEAFNSKDSQLRTGRVDIRRKGGMAHGLLYSWIGEITYDRDHYTGILLILSTKLVKIRGRNLKPVVDALFLGACEYIQEFRDDIFDKPVDPSAPFVEEIKIVTGREAQEEAAQG